MIYTHSTWRVIFLGPQNPHNMKWESLKDAVSELAIGNACLPENANIIHGILHDEVVILNSIFHLRTQAGFDLVLNDGLDLEDY